MKWHATVHKKTFLLGRLKITFEYRDNDGFMGRFGGGWNWALGFKAGGRTVIIFALLASVIVSIVKEPEP